MVLPLYEKEVLFKDLNKDESFSSKKVLNNIKNPDAKIERPSSFSEKHFKSNSNGIQFATQNNEISNSYKFFDQTKLPNPTEAVTNDNTQNNGNSEISDSFESPSYNVAINECKALPSLPEYLVPKNKNIEVSERKTTNNDNHENPPRKDKIKEIKALFVAINLGTQKQAAEALEILTAYTVEDKNDVIEAKAVPYFVRHLDITKINLCKFSVHALANLSCGTNEQKQAIFDAEGMNPLMECLKSTDLHIQATAAFTLSNIITDNKFPYNFDIKFINDLCKFLELINAEEHEFVTEGNIEFFKQRLNVLNTVLPIFVKLLGCNYITICTFSAKTLLNFVNYKSGNESHNYEQRKALIRFNTLPIFVQFLHSTDQKLCKLGAEAITFIAAGLIQQKQFVINANAIPALVKLLLTSNMETCLEAIKTLSKIVAGTNDQKQVVIDAGGCPLFVELLSFSDSEISTEALKALASISAGNLKHQKALYESESIPALIKFLNDSDLQKCNFALVILFNIINKAPERNQDLIKYGGIPSLTKLLINEDQKISFIALRILENISYGSTKDKQAIVQAFAIPTLIKLLDISKGNTYKIIMNILINIGMGTSEQRSAIIEAGGISYFCKILQSSDTDLVKDVIKLFSIISNSPQKKILTKGNILNSITSLLKSSNNFIVENSLEILQNITAENISDEILSTFGFIPMTVYLMYSENPLIVEKAVSINANISKGTNAQKQLLIDAGIIPITIKLLNSTDLNVSKNAIKILDEILKGTNDQIETIINEGAIPALQSLLKSSDTFISKIVGNILYKIINVSK
uniref:ARM repeat-containing protein n=1 Tax=Panagrolaimus davidi TaxID=227884 RepID=A0A914NZW6_9BILA